MDKEDVVFIYNGILLGDQKERNLAIGNNVVGIRVHYAKRNKSVRGKNTMISLMWNFRYKTDEHRGREAKII